MHTKIKINYGRHQVEAEIFDTPTGRAILESLPIEAQANTWGDEIYFLVAATATLETAAEDVVAIGDLAYWPTMPAFCIFFGPTPVSRGAEPRAASRVNVFGKLDNVDPGLLRQCRNGDKITVSRL